MAWFQSQEVLRHLNASEADAQVYGRLASSVIYGNALRRATPSVIGRNQLGQSGLWRFAISGDLPIVLMRIGALNRERGVRPSTIGEIIHLVQHYRRISHSHPG